MKVISVENVSKKFILAHDRPRNLADVARGMFQRKQREDFWALKGVSFEVEQGEAVGIIGHNGAGKSTMLKLLTRIMEPTSGRIRTRGRVSALIEVGAGFHPEMTGRENIYLNGSILGMTQREVAAKFDEIVAFAELERFIDTPVKRYSSGMYARLGFGVAAHVDPEVLLVDEVLSVGDLKFQQKCYSHIRRLVENGCSVALVTHSMLTARRICGRILWVNQGEIQLAGDPDSVINGYQDWVNRGAASSHAGCGTRWGTGDVRIANVTAKATRCQNVRGHDVEIGMDVEFSRRVANPIVWVMVTNSMGHRVGGSTTRRQSSVIPDLRENCHVKCLLREYPLQPDSYNVSVGIFDDSLVPLDRWGDCVSFVVDSDEGEDGLISYDFDGSILVDSDWQVFPAAAGSTAE